MKTADKIKKGLECCFPSEDPDCCDCPYRAMKGCFDARINDIHAYIQQLEAAAPKWISVEERLPQAFYSVLVYIPEEAPMPTVHEGYMADNGRWISTVYVREFEKVTHWMPLPEPPQEEI